MDNALLIGSVILGIAIIVGVVTLIFAVRSWREGQHISSQLAGRYSQVEEEVALERYNHSLAQVKVQQLEELLDKRRPEKLLWQVQHATEELEQLQHRLLETEHQVGAQKQEWLHQSEQQEQQLLRLEQERQHLMEELGRWHERHRAAQEQAALLKQEHSEAQQKVEELTRLRERLLTEMRDGDARNW